MLIAVLRLYNGWEAKPESCTVCTLLLLNIIPSHNMYSMCSLHNIIHVNYLADGLHMTLSFCFQGIHRVFLVMMDWQDEATLDILFLHVKME